PRKDNLVDLEFFWCEGRRITSSGAIRVAMYIGRDIIAVTKLIEEKLPRIVIPIVKIKFDGNTCEEMMMRNKSKLIREESNLGCVRSGHVDMSCVYEG
ncbi:hypothetical protein Tco_0504089, partial [Tanacetum coccineum]